ncbi:hypothetical protein DB41_IF00080 [Neochlamydia sp. TUME1]|uniref:DUF2156 domain-containing protein n=1 Tax=Neochlamydia sp. TUME1 TaxID=1478174 RepID=UPI00057ED025|nr:phosphatidylglycerol lysyltransferase domain-containing protein [Neochlamydia sp. TUME1]KIC74761.1 hypothetical protein DB41_IF00080 [Neochlamydia sp. TUME1]
MIIKPLTLEHQPLLSPAWRDLCVTYDLRFAEYSFANAFLFRKKYAYQFVECSTPCLQGRWQNNDCFVIPSVPPKQIKFKLSELLPGCTCCFFPLPDAWVEECQKMNMSLISCRADTDYLFRKSKLQTLQGRELSSRRNLLNQLERKYSLESKEIKEENIQEAFKLLERWQSQKEDSKETTDYYSCLEALTYISQLHLFGRIAYADGQAFGFTLGELLTPKTALLHFTKALTSIKGATPFLYRDFALSLPDSVQWINLEQDLGIPALRQAKNAYNPDLLLTKWKAS